MNWDDVRIFLAVARAGQILGAARRLSLNHATVSRRVAALEEALRTKLFRRLTTGSELTPAGERLLVIAERMEADMLAARAELAEGDGQVSGTVRVGAPDGFGVSYLAPRLGALVDRLAKLIEEQRKADAAAAERRRHELQLARAKAKSEAAAASKMSSIKAKTPNPDAIDNDEPPKLLARNELVPDASVQAGVFSRAFASLRGQLHLPVRGDVLAKFGSKRGDGPSWKGLFIRAPEGTEVKAVAGGRVVFADWLRGFGNLIIVDHGDEYMTIYGNNQAVLKRPGDLVKAGDAIASAGNSGGNEQSGLYFEMRHQGRAFDPLGWVTVR